MNTIKNIPNVTVIGNICLVSCVHFLPLFILYIRVWFHWEVSYGKHIYKNTNKVIDYEIVFDYVIYFVVLLFII